MPLNQLLKWVLFVSFLGQHVTALPQETYIKKLREFKNRLDTAKDDKMRVRLLMSMGGVNFQNGQYDTAMAYYAKSKELAIKTNNREYISIALSNISAIYMERGEYNKALEDLLKGLKIAEEMEHKEMIANTVGNIGLMYKRIKNDSLALQYFFRSEQLLIEIKDTIKIANICNNIATIYLNLGNIDKAAFYFKKCKTQIDQFENKDRPHVMYIQNVVEINIADLLLKQEKYAEALASIIPMWNRIKATADDGLKIEVLLIVAKACNGQKEFTKADNYLQSVKQLLTEVKEYDSYIDYYNTNIETQKGLNNYKKAFDDHQLLWRLKDSIFNKEKMEQLHTIQSKYDIEKKEAAIARLHAEKKLQQWILYLSVGLAVIALGVILLLYRSKHLQTKLFEQERSIENQRRLLEKSEIDKKITELEQASLRAQMNPHFIFNCLTSLKLSLNTKPPAETDRYISAFARLIRQTLDHTGKNLVPLNDEINYLENYLLLEQMRSGNAFDFKVDVDNAIDADEIRVPTMLLQPFVENSIKHGVAHKPDGRGEIQVSVSQKGHLQVVVKDNGVGRAQSRLYKASGGETHESKGMSITLNRVEMLNRMYNSDIRIVTEDISQPEEGGTGTKVTIQLPVYFG